MPRDAALPVPDLAGIQRWMQAVIAHPGGVEEALAAPEAASELAAERLGELIRPSHSLTPAERVEIYHGMYLMRMVEALETDYPTMRHFLGGEAFEALVQDYVGLFPSRSYTLNRLGDHLPRFFLEEPEREHAAFLHDLARTELAITEAFDAEETPILGPDGAQAVPPGAWPGARLTPTAALRLLELRHAVVPHLEAAKRGRPAPAPRRRATWLAVYRRDYSVLRLELGRTEFTLLRSLTEGVALGEAIAAAARQLRSAQREQTIFAWFRGWIAEGLFQSVTIEAVSADDQ